MIVECWIDSKLTRPMLPAPQCGLLGGSYGIWVNSQCQHHLSIILIAKREEPRVNGMRCQAFRGHMCNGNLFFASFSFAASTCALRTFNAMSSDALGVAWGIPGTLPLRKCPFGLCSNAKCNGSMPSQFFSCVAWG